ncbi:hypothetical protein [Plantactinospora sp. KBS50]|uniref:hypothetical protein n=1 Tax=Plantactinospora sp. KBS50 TaxID=2024580 RepID=UPI0012FE104B|nr:hypothetical protein [Plantactinospora sp. KBS50]
MVVKVVGARRSSVMSIRYLPVLVSRTAAVVVNRVNFLPSVTSRTCGEDPLQKIEHW